MGYSNWKVCLEIGLNHLGSYALLEEMIKFKGIAELGVAVTVQIREEEFYKTNKKFHLSIDEHLMFVDLCRELQIPCGLSLGPLSDLSVLKGSGLEPDFLKTLSVSSNNLDFMHQVREYYSCPKYVSIGLSDISYIKHNILPLMNDDDEFIHTCLSHDSADQNLGDIRLIEKLGFPVCYGLHATNHELIFTAIGSGANKIFCYVGEKSFSLPDCEHALDMIEISEYVEKIGESYSSLGCSPDGSKSSKIDFIK
ncbi:N-acetylneuraminate synthase family protein [Alphaproteobacteria bacterium]|nr:N-acetylneuraminate synthase family protein [Alphaproteobacteria bacterium]